MLNDTLMHEELLAVFIYSQLQAIVQSLCWLIIIYNYSMGSYIKVNYEDFYET